MATLTKSDIAALSVDERFALVDDIFDSFLGAEETLPTPDWHRQVIEARLAKAERNPGATIPWEALKAEMTEKWLR